ncbi:SMP-30/gluconolactonase/LRE family protein [Inquilinus sp. YAF38]|uniref:SMP-30/gluconolactonase/LRE family protein n=1 Tax=Inquilinus sp. YAF38 TaxID=3233084 RepID=UPI003F916B67
MPDVRGNICVATLITGCITVIAPDGAVLDQVMLPDDPIVTNICFGGPERRTTYITLSGTGRLVAMEWLEPGLELAYSR